MLESIAILLEYLPVALAVLGALSLFVASVAKLTSTDKDDVVAKFLVGLHDFLSKLVPGQAKLAAKETASRVGKAGARIVIDHRSK